MEDNATPVDGMDVTIPEGRTNQTGLENIMMRMMGRLEELSGAVADMQPIINRMALQSPIPKDRASDISSEERKSSRDGSLPNFSHIANKFGYVLSDPEDDSHDRRGTIFTKARRVEKDAKDPNLRKNQTPFPHKLKTSIYSLDS